MTASDPGSEASARSGAADQPVPVATGAVSRWPDEAIDEVARLVLATPGVAGLTAGAFGDMATYLPGRRLAGVRQRHGRTEVCLVLSWGASAQLVGRRIRQQLRDVVEGEVDVVVADIEAPAGAPEDTRSEPVTDPRSTTDALAPGDSRARRA